MATGAGVSIARQQGSHARWNFTVFGADIAFFSLGLSISSVYTVLPLFVHHLTTNNEAVALIPALRALGLYVPPLLVASLVERRRHALPFVLKATILERVPFLVLALGALWLSHGSPTALLALFFVMIFLALLGSGLTYPAWLDMIARSVPSDWLGRFFGFWSGLGGLLGIGGAAIAAALIAQVSWPLNFALCFLLTFGSYIVSFVLLALGREPSRQLKHVPSEQPAESVSLAMSVVRMRQGARDLWGLVRSDGGLQRLIVSNGLGGTATMAGALFAVAALRRGGLSDAQVGVESTVLFIAMTVGYFLWGIVGDRFGHRAILVFGSLSAALSALVALGAFGFWAYAVVFWLLGLNAAATSLAGLTFITEFGPAVRRPTYIALAAVAYAPFAVGAPIVGGFLANAWGYVPVFIVSAVAGLLATVAFQLWVPNPRARSRAAEAASAQ